jgi:MFS family permease
MSLTLLGTDAPAREQHRDRWGALVVLCAAALIINLDNTILNVALPTLVRDTEPPSSQLQWIVDSYAMVFAGLLLVDGGLADRFRPKRFFLTGLAVFAAAPAPSARVRSTCRLPFVP